MSDEKDWLNNPFGDESFQKDQGPGWDGTIKEDPAKDGFEDQENWCDYGPVKQSITVTRTESVEKPWKRTAGIACICLGIACMLLAVYFIAWGGKRLDREEEKPVEIFDAKWKDQYAYVEIKYMTDSIAYHEGMRSLNYHLTMDTLGNYAVVCVDDKYLESYQPYIDNTYADEEVEMEPLKVFGYAQPIDDELWQYVGDELEYDFGKRPTRQQMINAIGENYLYIGESKKVAGDSVSGMIAVLIAIVSFAAGATLLVQGSEKQRVYANGVIIREEGRNLGIVGAIGGACLGGVAWILVSLCGFVSGWIGLLTLYLSNAGYKMLCRGNDQNSQSVSMLCSLLMVMPATYLAWTFQYQKLMNENIGGYTTFWDALVKLKDYLMTDEIWKVFLKELSISYAAMLIGVGIFAAIRKRRG